MKQFHAPLKIPARGVALLSAALLASIPLHSHASTHSLFDANSANTIAKVVTAPNGFKQALVTVNTAPFAVFNSKPAPTAGVDDIPDEIEIPLFDGESATAIFDRYASGWGGVSTWVGHLKSDPSSQIYLSFKGSTMQGNINIGQEQYQLRYHSGSDGNTLHKMSHLDPSTIPPEHDPADPPIPEGNGGSVDPSADANGDTGANIDVLVVATNNAITAMGGANATIALANLAITETNTGYANSGINTTMTLVGLYSNSYVSSGSFVTDVIRLEDPYDAYMNGIHTIRDTVGADMVALLVDNGTSCGRAAAINASESEAFQVTHYGCATGYYSFGHEFGHLQAARHDWTADGTNNSPYTYNHGYVVASESWRTVMGYNNSSTCVGGYCTRLNYWSNPNNNHPSTGTVMGVPDGSSNPAENYRTLNNTAYKVANFRSGQPDVYEPDNSSIAASLISDGYPKTHTMHTATDEDWSRFVLTCRSKVVIETSSAAAASGDTRMWLYDDTLSEIAYDDDGGAGGYSKITSGILEPGTYFIKVDEYGQNQTIATYDLAFDVTAQSCMTSCLGLPITVDLNFGEVPTPLADVIAGTPGNDTVFGLNGDDRMCGGDGHDSLYGQGGNDHIDGGPGDDSLYGGSGNDLLDGNAGDDLILGQGGADTLYGGFVSGYDTLYGGAANDMIHTEAGGGYARGNGNNDTIYGSVDDDVIYGNSGLDTLYGFEGTDYIYGGLGADALWGGSGDDTLKGEGHKDKLYGEAGNDTLFGGNGNDSMDGGADTDVCNGQGGVDSDTGCETVSRPAATSQAENASDAPPAQLIPSRVFSDAELAVLDNCDKSLDVCLKK